MARLENVGHWRITSRITGILALAILLGAAAGGFLYVRLRVVAAAYETLFDHDVRCLLYTSRCV